VNPAAASEAGSRLITACPVGCEAALEPTDIVLPEGALLECTACGQLGSQVTEVLYWNTMAAFDEPDFNQPAGRELERRNDVAKRRLGRIVAMLGKSVRPLRLLDVGRSRGQFVAAAVAMSLDAEGVEPAPHIAQAARAAGLKVRSGLLEDQHYPDAAFDAVTLFEVIEHLKAPLPLMRECARILRSRGILCLTTGNAASWTATAMREKWDYFDMRKDAGHVSFFNPRSLALLARRANLELASVRTSRVRFFEKGDTGRMRYATAKLGAELLSMPASLLGRGHDMLAFMRKV
jgi:2-polyprenyl-3-methyl-5-hydroxy-6-metoxy-1,4-benzoquinol methylase